MIISVAIKTAVTTLVPDRPKVKNLPLRSLDVIEPNRAGTWALNQVGRNSR